MEKNILVFFVILSFSINAQNKKDFWGSYKDPSGAVVKINEDKSFAIVGYATVLTGKWQLTGQYIELIPSTPNHVYEVYGRHEPSLKGSKIMFYGFEDSKNLFSEDASRWISVFNQDPNCFSFPYVKHFSGVFKTISLCSTELLKQGLFETAENCSGYNDFIIISNYRSRKAKTVTYRLINDTLYDLYREDPLRKTQLSSEDQKMFSSIETEARNFYKNSEKIYANNAYNMEIPDINEQQYMFDQKRNAYVDRFNEPDPHNAYHDMSIINEYQKFEINSVPGKTAHIEKGSLFHAGCTEN